MNLLPLRYSFEPFASVQFNEGQAQPIDNHPSMFVQCMDAYSYQRELIIEWSKESNNYIIHSYLHSSMRNIQNVSKLLGERIMDKFNTHCRDYPYTLFNSNDTRPRAEGFVGFHTKCLGGIDPAIAIKCF